MWYQCSPHKWHSQRKRGTSLIFLEKYSKRSLLLTFLVIKMQLSPRVYINPNTLNSKLVNRRQWFPDGAKSGWTLLSESWKCTENHKSSAIKLLVGIELKTLRKELLTLKKKHQNAQPSALESLMWFFLLRSSLILNFFLFVFKAKEGIFQRNFASITNTSVSATKSRIHIRKSFRKLIFYQPFSTESCLQFFHNNKHHFRFSYKISYSH